MNHEEYINSVRAKIGHTAQEMINGNKNYLEGAVEIVSLYHEAEIEEQNKDFNIFIGIPSETDHLPIGEMRKNWSKEALEKHEAEIQETTKWAKDISLNQCSLLAKKYGT